MKLIKTVIGICTIINGFCIQAQESDQQDTITYDFINSVDLLTEPDSLSEGMVRFRQAYQEMLESYEFDPSLISESGKMEIFQAIDSLRQGLVAAEQSAQQEESTSARTSSASSSSATPGESGTSQTVVALPSPSSLGKVSIGNDMVNLYTGDLNYNIPLFNLESRDLSVPISISYNSSSNKVDNISSEIGMGWSLAAGGLIARVMKGLPDEFQGSINASPTPGSTNTFNGYGWLKVKSRKIENKGITILSPDDFKTRFSLASRKNIIENSALGGDVTNQVTKTEGWDTEPDEFYFNFGKYSGKFVFSQSGDVHIVPSQELTIDKTIGTVNGKDQIIEFTVQTPEGVSYTFGSSDPNSLDAVEISQMYTYSNTTLYDYPFIDYLNDNGYLIPLYIPVPFMNWKFNRASEWIYNNDNRNQWKYPEFTSTWHLKKIESQNDQIDFEYQDEGEVTYFQNKSASVKMPNIPRIVVNDGTTNFVVGISPEEYIVSAQRKIFPELSTHTRSYQYMILKSKRLKSISTSTGSIANFDSNSSRKDLVGSSRLRKIRINQGSTEIVSYDFDQSYMQSEGELYTILEGFHNGEPMFYIEDDLIYGLMKTFDDAVTENQVLKLIDSEHFRLRLDRIVEKRNGNQLPPTILSYNQTKLPRRFSADQDKWGYYNNNTRNTLVPRPSYKNIIDNSTINSSLFLWDRIKTNLSTTVDDVVEKWECENNDCARLGGIRSVHSGRVQAGLLTRIDHSLGGFTSFTYNLEKAAYGGSLFTVSGAKVSEVTYSPNDVSNPVMTHYKFEDGRAPNSVSFGYSLKSSDYFQDEIHRTYTFSSHPITSSFTTSGSYVGFGKVSVSQESKGKTSYEFITPLDIANKRATILEYNLGNQSGNNQYPFAPEDNDWMRGKIDKVSSFKEGESTPFMVVDYEYELTGNNLLYGMKPGFYGYRSLLGGGFPAYEAAFYSYNSAVYRVRETIETLAGDRDVSTFTTKTAEFDYVPEYPEYTRGVITTYEDGSQDSVSTKYVFDYFEDGDQIPTIAAFDAEGLWDLRDHGYAFTPIEIIKRRRLSSTDNWFVVGGQLSTFQRGTRFDSNSSTSEVYLKEKKALVLDAPISMSSFSESRLNSNKTLFLTDSRYKVQTTFLDYNSKGRPLRSSDRTGLETKMAWTHYNSLLSSITSNSSGSTQMKTTYQYEPLVGITQVKDENNKITNYTYDNLNRLYLVKDNEGNIMERYRYNYRNQTQSSSFYTNFRTSAGYNLTCDPLRFSSTDIETFGASEYTWDFGDGGIEEECPTKPFPGEGPEPTQSTVGKNVHHRFSQAGTYDVTVTRFNPDVGKEVSRTQSITIYNSIATVKLFAPDQVQDCSSNDETYTAQVIPIDDEGGDNPSIYVRVGYDNDGAICTEGGYSHAMLRYKDYYGNWQVFSNTNAGTIPDEAFNYQSAPFDIEVEGTFSDKCSTTSHVVTKIIQVVPCAN